MPFLHIDDKTWSRTKDIFSIISSFSTLVIAILGVVISVNIHTWQKKQTDNLHSWQKQQSKILQTVAANTRIEDFNNLFITIEELQQLELDLQISKHLNNKSDVIKMYTYFKWLNYALNLYISGKADGLDKEFLESRVAVFTKLTFPDQDFIEKNCFHRGYPESFQNFMRENWKNLVKNSSNK